MKLSFEDPSTWGPLFKVATQCEVDPGISIESEAFFIALFERYDGPEDDEAVEAWLHDEISRYFVSISGTKPNRIQGAEWPFHNGRPMAFAGQLDIPGGNSNEVSFYHDDTSLYVFIAPEAEPVVITQHD